MDIRQELSKVAAFISKSSIDGFSKQKALKYVNNMLEQYTKGYHKDDSWKPINNFFKQLGFENINYEIDETKYQQNKDGNPESKYWYVTITFINDKQKEIKLFGKIQASGAGTVNEPLSSYDVIGYFS